MHSDTQKTTDVDADAGTLLLRLAMEGNEGLALARTLRDWSIEALLRALGVGKSHPIRHSCHTSFPHVSHPIFLHLSYPIVPTHGTPTPPPPHCHIPPFFPT